MANKIVFSTNPGNLIPDTDTRNSENAPAYKLRPKHALAQYAATGCFNRTFYAAAEDQLANVLELCNDAGPDFVARTAIYSRAKSYMKDMPALLCAWLAANHARLHEAVFAKVIDNARMLRNYVQILRSGVVGRKSLGTAPKRLVRQWLAARTESDLFAASAGQKPSLADVLRMVHPKPASASREALYGYLLGRPFDPEELPELVAHFERFKAGDDLRVPDLPFQLLTALPLSRNDWADVARTASWQTTRMNLNTFARHGVFDIDGMTGMVAARLRNAAEIQRARVFPYQLLAAFINCEQGVPAEVRDALQDAMEIAIANVPAIDGRVVVCPDVSGSMMGSITGFRRGSSTTVRCVDIAALVAAAVLRRNPSATVLPFEYDVVPLDLNARDSVMTNAQRLGSIGGGGTNCSAPVRLLNQRREFADLVILVSDNESWIDQGQGRGTALMAEWAEFRYRNPQARLVCLDIQPNRTTQAVDCEDILNIGGFSDQVFSTVTAFASGRMDAGSWVTEIESVVV